MEITRISLHRLLHVPHHFDAVVAIDVLRSFTTSAFALACGAPAIYPVETVSAANALKRMLPSAVTVGALPGGKPMPGFDLGNSPSAIQATPLYGHPVILTTAAGVRAIARFRNAPHLFAASLVCAGATAQAVMACGARRIALVTTGEWIDRDGDEDIACADYLHTVFDGGQPDAGALALRVRHSDFGRRFASGLDPSLPMADLDLCAQVDRFAFAMPVTRHGEHLVIQAATPGTVPRTA